MESRVILVILAPKQDPWSVENNEEESTVSKVEGKK